LIILLRGKAAVRLVIITYFVSIETVIITDMHHLVFGRKHLI